MVPLKSQTPREKRAPRWGHQSERATTLPSLPRKKTMSSSSILTLTGFLCPTFLAQTPGYQYSRKPTLGM